MYYGKFEDGSFIFAPAKLTVGGVTIYNPTDEILLAAGFKPMIYSDPPDAPDGYYYDNEWEERENEIVQMWHLVELPPHEMTAEEALEIILGGAT